MSLDNFNFTRVQKAIEFISENVKQQPDLFTVAEVADLSPFHFQKLFTEWVGVSPKKFLQFLTTSYLKERISQTTSLIEAADIAGLSSQSRVYDLFINIEAVTPNEFKTGGKGLDIFYGIHNTNFGECFIAVTERGVCQMSFIEDGLAKNDLERLSKKWSFAKISMDQSLTKNYIERIFKKNKSSIDKLNLLVQGTNFQLKVWEALLRVPEGALTTYQKIAESINHPKAVRAVGTAVGDNPIAYLIPCHRVIRKEGILGEYRWGSVRKKAMVGWEAIQFDLLS